jgi:hypothetical protein
MQVPPECQAAYLNIADAELEHSGVF